MAVSAETIARLSGIHHHFDGAPVLGAVDIELGAGEIVAIVGPSGCGKTTLLRIAAGLLSPTRGDVSRPRNEIGFVFQEPALLPWRRVGANAQLLADRTDGRLVEHLLSISGLAEHRDKWPHQLSGGMKMRLSLVRALASRPRLLLMDEPFGALDQITRNHLHDEFTSLHASQKFSALLVTHAIDEAVYLADRVLVMSGAPGRIVQEFTIGLTSPRTTDVRYSSEFASLCGTIAQSLQRHAGGA